MKPANKSLLLGLVLSLFVGVIACEQPGGSSGTSATLDGGQDFDGGAGGPSELACNASTNAGIVGGQAVDNTSWIGKGIVFIMQEYQLDRETHTSICTGSLIDRNIVLTAAHCVDKSRNNVSNLSVYFSAQPECDSNHGRLSQKRKSVAELRIHPSWNPATSETTSRGDIALIRIYGKAPSAYVPVKLAKDFLPLPETQKIVIAGYGMTNPDYYGDFGGSVSLRMADALPINGGERAYLVQLTGDQNEFNNLASNEMLYIDQSRGKGICGGDSGGPSFMQNAAGEPVVTGVASFVMNPRNAGRLCGYVAAHTSTYFHKLWIDQNFKMMRTAESSFETPYR